jgi:hypothetical protein
MAKTPTTAGPTDAAQEGLPSGDPAVKPAADETTPPEGGEPEVPETELSAYDQAVAFEPDPWDQLPADPEVRALYLALNGHINFFIKRRA